MERGKRNWREIGVTVLPEKQVYENCTMMPVKITLGDVWEITKGCAVAGFYIALGGGFLLALVHEVSKKLP